MQRAALRVPRHRRLHARAVLHDALADRHPLDALRRRIRPASRRIRLPGAGLRALCSVLGKFGFFRSLLCRLRGRCRAGLRALCCGIRQRRLFLCFQRRLSSRCRAGLCALRRCVRKHGLRIGLLRRLCGLHCCTRCILCCAVCRLCRIIRFYRRIPGIRSFGGCVSRRFLRLLDRRFQLRKSPRQIIVAWYGATGVNHRPIAVALDVARKP